MKIKFKNGSRTLVMKVQEFLSNGDARLIDGSVVEKKDILETIKL